jgi:hypothetical protein
MQSWIGDAALACDRDKPEEWMLAIGLLDEPEMYAKWSELSKAHIESMDLFTEASRIAGLVESFARENPVAIRAVQSAGQETRRQDLMPAMSREPTGPVGFGFVNGQLRIRR